MVNIFLQLTTKKDSEQKLIAIREKKKIFQQLELRIEKKQEKQKKILKGKTFLFWNFFCAFSDFHGSLNNNFPKFYFKIFKTQNHV